MKLPVMFRRGTATLPMGIDIGETRVRAALLEADDGVPRLVAVATRERAGSLSESLREIVADLGTSERRCVLGVTEPDAFVRSVAFPTMPARERAQAARFEADRFAQPDEPIIVRIFPLETAGRFALGIAKRRIIDERLRTARETGLTCIAVDNAGFAYQRLVSRTDAVLDLGASAATLYLFGERIPSTSRFDTGGDRLTGALAESLAIDRESAERRKRTHGLAGSASVTLTALVESVAGSLVGARSRGMRIEHLALVGNGARLDDLIPALSSATGLSVGRLDTMPVSCDTLPPDVVRAELADWALAIGLALRGLA
jgi:Tfp pilus assembly PilM family ATPase